MRRTLILGGLVAALASPAAAQPTRGSFGLDALVAPTTGLGFAWYVTDGLSLRPWLGLGYSDYGGFYANLGAQVRFEPIPRATVSPYLSGTAQYSHSDGARAERYGETPTGGSQRLAVGGSGGLFGAGAGLRFGVASSLSLFAEGRVMYTTWSSSAFDPGWSTIPINDKARAEVVLGLTYFFR